MKNTPIINYISSTHTHTHTHTHLFLYKKMLTLFPHRTQRTSSNFIPTHPQRKNKRSTQKQSNSICIHSYLLECSSHSLWIIICYLCTSWTLWILVWIITWYCSEGSVCRRSDNTGASRGNGWTVQQTFLLKNRFLYFRMLIEMKFLCCWMN